MTDATATDIVVGVDDSPQSHPALRWAAAEAALRDSPLVIVYAAAPGAGTWSAVPAPAGLLNWQQQTGLRILRDAEQIATDIVAGRVRVSTEFVVEAPTPTLVERSRRAQLVVVGSRGRGAVARAVLGSVATGLVHRAHCPVAVVHDENTTEPAPDAPVVVGADGSAAAEPAIEIAFGEAARRGWSSSPCARGGHPARSSCPGSTGTRCVPTSNVSWPGNWPDGSSATRRCRCAPWWCSISPRVD